MTQVHRRLTRSYSPIFRQELFHFVCLFSFYNSSNTNTYLKKLLFLVYRLCFNAEYRHTISITLLIFGVRDGNKVGFSRPTASACCIVLKYYFDIKRKFSEVMMNLVNDPCGIFCIVFTYTSIIYADYVVIKWVVLHTMQDR